MIPGEEVSVIVRNGTVPIHVNSIGITELVEPIDAEGIVPTLQANVDATLQAGGIASINHPNYEWAFDHESIRQVNSASLLEVAPCSRSSSTLLQLSITNFSCSRA